MAERWSYSKFNTADTCLRLFQNQYESEERLPLLYDNLRETGKGVHRCREMYVEHLAASNLEQDLNMVSFIVEEYFATDPEVTSSECYHDVLSVFKAFAERYRHNPETYFGGEILTDRELPETDIVVAGFPDHIEQMVDKDGPIIVAEDMKAGYSTTVTAANKLQGEIEAWKIQSMFPGKRVGWRVSWPREGTESEVVEFKETFAPVLEARLRSIIQRIENARERRRWPAQPGSACSYCPLAVNCRERQVLADLDIIVTDRKSAKKAAEDLILLDAAYGQRREQVKSWAAEHGPIVVGDLEAAFRMAIEGGDKIGDLGIMILRLGLLKLIENGVFAGEDDPKIKEPESVNLIARTGVEIAIAEKLISINGNKTKTKAVKNDPRFKGLWVPPDTKSKFDLYKVERETEAV